MGVRLILKDGCLTALLSGEIDHHVARELREEIDGTAMRTRPSVLKLDFSGVQFMDSSGIAVILKTDRLLRQTGGALALCGVPRQVRRVLDVAGLTNIVPVLEDRVKECEQC